MSIVAQAASCQGQLAFNCFRRRLAGHELKTLYEKKTGSELDIKKLGCRNFKQLIEDIPSVKLAYSGKNQTTMHVLMCCDGQKQEWLSYLVAFGIPIYFEYELCNPIAKNN